MPKLSENHPNLALFLIIEKMQEPVAYFWNLTISLQGEEPPNTPAPRRVFRLDGTTEALKLALDEYPCDNVNIFAETHCPSEIISLVTFLVEQKAVEKQSQELVDSSTGG